VGELARRRSETAARLDQLREELKMAERLAAGKACVYATGSFGRCEASPHSDLDLFIVGKDGGSPRHDGTEGSMLRRLDEICIKADLIYATRRMKIPEFSGDGRYLVHYSVNDFTKTLGTPEDDVTNTFTARLLLLLESCPLLEPLVYRDVTQDVIAAYWRDYADHKTDFMPAFLANDILRLWRTFCVNYEARTARVPDEEKAKGKLRNYKLKHSRLLTCYSAILFLLALYGEYKSVSPANVVEMIGLTPTERIEWLIQQPYLAPAKSALSLLLDRYERFLDTTNTDEKELVRRLLNHKTSRTYMSAAHEFGDTVFEAMTLIGQGNRFHRLLVV